ncbi:MAG TPA: hypothetical protein VHN37_03745 [Actinomycetota bacterium]|nr:hypothetical protein [Actinomycetota bacterium]
MTRPPLVLRFLYRTDLWILGPRWREWVEQDTASPSFAVKESLATTVLGVVAVTAYVALPGGDEALMLGLGGVMVVTVWASLALRSVRERLGSWKLERHRRRWAKAEARSR